MKELKCPICKKGNMQEGGNGYFCDYIKTDEDFCKFQIFKNYSGVTVTATLLGQLIMKKKTDVLEFQNKDGLKFFGRLKLSDDNHVVINFDNNYLRGKCPQCAHRILATPKGFFCESDKCNFVVFPKIANKEMKLHDVENIISREEPYFHTDLSNKKGDLFGAKIKYDNTLTQLILDFDLCKCRICGKGKIRNKNSVYYCSNEDCRFTAFENSNGATLFPSDIVELMKLRKTRMITFKTREGKKYKGVYVLNSSGKLLIK